MHEERISVRAACLRVLDFGWDDLGKAVADAWNLPDQVSMCMQAAPATHPVQRSLASIANYGHGLTEALYRCGDRFDQVHLRTVLNLSGQPVLIPVRDLRRSSIILRRKRVPSCRTWGSRSTSCAWCGRWRKRARPWLSEWRGNCTVGGRISRW